MPVSAARQSANDANARLSTGPTTPDGKARSAQNARKHGLTAKDLIIGPEDREEFNDLLAGFEADVAPQGTLQQSLFDQLVAAAWNLRRIRRIETEICSRASTYGDLINDNEIQTKLERLARHNSRIERTFHRSLKELKALQTSAAVQPFIPRQIRETAPPLASSIEIAKRTQAGGPAGLVKAELEAIDPDARRPEGRRVRRHRCQRARTRAGSHRVTPPELCYFRQGPRRFCHSSEKCFSLRRSPM